MSVNDQCTVYIPPEEERHRIVMERIMARKDLIPDIEHLKQNNKKLFDFLYHFEDHGWAIYHVYDDQMIDNLLEETSTRLKKINPDFDMTKQETYGEFPFDMIGFIELYHLRNLYKLRFHEPMVQLFQILYNTKDIRAQIDRMGFKRSLYQIINGEVIERKDYAHGGFLHHDMNLFTDYSHSPIQCVVALNDTDQDMGGWKGIDYFHYNAKKWATECDESYLARLKAPNAKIPVNIPNPDKWQTINPAMNKGDILVWKSETAHGNGANLNRMGLPRMAAYINYVSSEHEDKFDRESRLDQIECFKTGKHPRDYPLKHRELEVPDYEPYPLNEQTKKLMGIE
jgi:hypothetical protein